MGLRFPADLAGWQAWQRRRNAGRTLISALRPQSRPSYELASNGPDPQLLVVVESASAGSISMLEPLKHLEGVPIGVVSPFPVAATLPGGPWRTTRVSELSLPSVRAVLGAGHYLPLNEQGYRLAARQKAVFGVVQHGLLTPMAPPLPRNAHLLSWSDADAAYWTHERTDVTCDSVGSELLWRAGVDAVGAGNGGAERRPLFLGQLHGAELSRAQMSEAILRACAHGRADYRPHPSETDRLSQATHKAFEAAGVRVARDATPLRLLDRPVVSIYSTGILEAAARGRSAWAYLPRPPAWLGEFWERNGMSRWGDEPTPPPPLPDVRPARSIAAWVRSTLA